MKFFVNPTDPPALKTKNIRKVSLLLAAIFLVIAVAQLFTFEKFPSSITAMGLPGGEAYSQLRAAVIVILEVFALPFLLRMRLSPAMRVFSMIAGWLAILAWLVASLLMNKNGNSGILGATVAIPAGWWVVFFMLGLVVLAIWTAWGMWPVKATRK